MKRRQFLSTTAAATTAWMTNRVAVAASERGKAQAASQDKRSGADIAPTRIIVPFAAGGVVDMTVRILAEAVREEFGSVVVENRTGVGGNLGMAEVARAASDGKTLGVASVSTHAISPWLYSKLPFDAVADFTPVTLITRGFNVLVVKAEYARLAGIDTVDDLVRWAKQRPGQLTFGSSGSGSSGHLAGEVFKRYANFFAVHMPYRGAGLVQQALLNGEIDFCINHLAAAWDDIQTGQVKALAVTSLTRDPMLPGVPTLAKTIPGFAVESWWGLCGPRGMSVERVYAINAAFARAMQTAEVREKFAAFNLVPKSSSPQEFAAFIQEQRSIYRDIVLNSGATVDG